MTNFEAHIKNIQNYKIDELFKEVASYGEERNLTTFQPIRTRQHNQLPECYRAILKEYCDVLLAQIKDRYTFTGHLSAVSLFFQKGFRITEQLSLRTFLKKQLMLIHL